VSKRKGKGICRGGESKAGKEKSSDKEEKESEKGDEKEERSEAGVGWYFYTGHLEFAAPTSRGIKAPFPLVPRSTVVLVPCHPALRLQPSTLARQISLASRTSSSHPEPPLRTFLYKENDTQTHPQNIRI